MILISNLILYIEDGSTIASTDIFTSHAYVNIGSGNIFKLYWETPTSTTDAVDHYSLVIKRHDTTINVYYDIFNKNIGLVNEFYVDSSLLPALPEQYMLSIYLVAYSKQGSILTSNIINPYVVRGSGTYVKVEEAGAPAIMKRALTLVKMPLSEEPTVIIRDQEGEIAHIFDGEGNVVTPKATRVLKSTNGWALTQGCSIKDADGNWRANDIRYEVLVDNTGSIVTDNTGWPVYVL